MPRAPKLPPLSAAARDAQWESTLALAVIKLRASAAWTSDEQAEALCEYKPPFGFRDSAGRVNGILWSAPSSNSSNASASGRRLAAPENETVALEACLRLAHVLRRTTARPAHAAHGTCAVVGSSGGLSGSGQGARIDAHDAIYRFNSAPTGGPYLADVGNRTSVWIASHIPWRMQAKLEAGRRRSGDVSEVAALYCFNPWLGSCHVEAMGSKKLGITMPHMLNPQLAAAMMRIQVALGGKSGGSVRPSTGLIGVGLALASCARVSLYGFGNDSDPVMQGHCNHYYDCRTNQTNYFAGRMGYHDWHGQWRVLAALINLGVLEYVPPNGPPGVYTQRPPTAAEKRAIAKRAARSSKKAAVAAASSSSSSSSSSSPAPAATKRAGRSNGHNSSRLSMQERAAKWQKAVARNGNNASKATDPYARLKNAVLGGGGKGGGRGGRAASDKGKGRGALRRLNHTAASKDERTLLGF